MRDGALPWNELVWRPPSITDAPIAQSTKLSAAVPSHEFGESAVPAMHVRRLQTVVQWLSTTCAAVGAIAAAVDVAVVDAGKKGRDAGRALNGAQCRGHLARFHVCWTVSSVVWLITTWSGSMMRSIRSSKQTRSFGLRHAIDDHRDVFFLFRV